MQPTFVDDIFIYTSNHRSLYLNPEAPDWITVDEKYKPLLDLVDGKNDDTVIYEYIGCFYSDEKDILTAQIKSLLADSKIFRHNQIPDNCIVGTEVNTPKSIYLTLTDSCNLKCVYCYATERKKRENTALETWRKYVADIIDFSEKTVFVFTGGEPLTVPYMFDLAAYIQERGCECFLLTNGTLINTDEIADKVAKYFSMVKVSLDTLDENISKELRGPGVAEKARNAFNLLTERKCNIQILATVTSKTCQNLDSLTGSFNNQIHFQPLYRDMGRARDKEDLSITGERYYDALSASKIFTGFHKDIHNYRNNPCKRCSLAKEELSVDADGNVYPCHMLHFENLVCGNLNKEKISDIYKNSPVLNELRTINVDTIPECRVCVYRNICGGACRARVDINKHGIKGHDDFCTFEKKAILDALLYSYG